MRFDFLRRRKQLEKKQLVLLYASLGLIILTVIGVSAFASYSYFKEQKNTSTHSNLPDLSEEIVFDLEKIKEEDKETLNILLAGYGGAGHQGGYLSDVIQVVHINFPKQKITFISIPRDFYLQEGYKINALMSKGMSQGKIEDGLALMQTTLSQITGLPIRYYIGIDFVSFKRVIGNELDGIEVEVSQTLHDPWYPIDGAQLEPCGYSPEEIAALTAAHSGFELESKFACRYEEIRFEKGLVKMEGHDALAYVRSRHSSSDYDRSRRQVEVLAGIRKKLFDLETLKQVPKFHQAFSKHVTSNLDLESAQYFAPLLLEAHAFEIQNINLSPENVLQSGQSGQGAFILTPKEGIGNFTGIRNFIQAAM